MQDKNQEVKENKEVTLDAEKLKTVRSYYSNMAAIITQRVQFYHEEFESIQALFNFLKLQVEEIDKVLEKLDPKKEEKDGTEKTAE